MSYNTTHIRDNRNTVALGKFTLLKIQGATTLEAVAAMELKTIRATQRVTRRLNRLLRRTGGVA